MTEGRKIRRYFERTKSGARSRGHPASEKQKETIRARNLMNNPNKTPEAREKARIRNTGKKDSDSTKAKKSESNKKVYLQGKILTAFRIGHKKSKEHIAVLTNKALTNNPLKNPVIKKQHKERMNSIEIKKKMSESQKKRNNPFLFKKGYKVPEEVKLAQTARALTNNPMSNPQFAKKRGRSHTRSHDKKVAPIKQDILNDYHNGLSFVDTSVKYHLGQKYLRRILKSEGIGVRTRHEHAMLQSLQRAKKEVGHEEDIAN